jgi:hypothetical protein
MKRLSQRIVLSLVAFALMVSFTSCDFLMGSSYDFSKQADADKAKEKIAKEIPADALIANITWGFASNTEQLTNELNITNIFYFDATSKELKNIYINGFSNEVKDRSDRINPIDKNKYKIEDTVAFSDLDFSKIAGNIKKAEEIITAEDLPFSGIENYEITVDPSTKQVIHNFGIQSKGDTKSKIKHGQMISETEYYVIPFIADNNGNVTLAE